MISYYYRSKKTQGQCAVFRNAPGANPALCTWQSPDIVSELVDALRCISWFLRSTTLIIRGRAIFLRYCCVRDLWDTAGEEPCDCAVVQHRSGGVGGSGSDNMRQSTLPIVNWLSCCTFGDGAFLSSWMDFFVLSHQSVKNRTTAEQKSGPPVGCVRYFSTVF